MLGQILATDSDTTAFLGGGHLHMKVFFILLLVLTLTTLVISITAHSSMNTQATEETDDVTFLPEEHPESCL